jgi:DnaJ-class molecular chaperone
MEAMMTDTDPDFAVGATARRIADLEGEIKRLLERLDEMRDAAKEDMKCPACDGTGKFDEDVGDTLVECKNCGGTGVWGKKTSAALAKLEERWPTC